MPRPYYTNQFSYSAGGVGRAELHLLGISAPSRLCVEIGYPKNAQIMIQNIPAAARRIQSRVGVPRSRGWLLGDSLVLGVWLLGFGISLQRTLNPMTLKFLTTVRFLSPLPVGEGQGEGQTGSRRFPEFRFDFRNCTWSRIDARRFSPAHFLTFSPAGDRSNHLTDD